MDLEELKKIHIKNRRKLETAITHLNRSLNQSIKSGNRDLEYLNIRLLIILWMSWAETALNCMLYSHFQVTPEIRISVNSCRTEKDRWIAMVDIFFKKHYLSKKQTEITKLHVGDTAYHRYLTLINIIEKEVGAFIEIRNKLAHGQWVVALNNEGTLKNQDITKRIWTLTKGDVLLLKSTLQNITKLLNTLISSKTAFERDFDLYVNRIDKAKHDFEGKLEWLISFLRNRKGVKK